MFKNYFKIAFRNLNKRREYFILNILGLTIGMSCCLLIFHYVSYEWSYDNFIPQPENIVRLRLDNYQNGKLGWQSATVYPAIAPNMKKDFPEVEDYCRLIDANVLLSNDERNIKFNETKGYYADAAFLKMFNVHLTGSTIEDPLNGPDKMVISESMSKKYFGVVNAIGKQLVVKDAGFPQTYEVTGVFKDYPKNAHLIIDYLISYKTFSHLTTLSGDTSNATETAFNWYDFYAYLKLKPGADYKKLEAKLPAFCDRYINSRDYNKVNSVRNELYLIPITDIHLNSNYNQEAEVNGSGQAVSFLFLIAIFIIGIAWINYINLATARSVERAREVGVRKVLGAIRLDLISQFLMESVLINIIALVLSTMIFLLLLKSFDQFTGREYFTGISLTANYWQLFSLLFISGTFLSGLYPAFVLSSFQPVTVIKGAFKNTSGGISLRKGLIVAQFVISVVLIAGTMIVYRQVQFMRNQQLGVNIDQTLVINGAGTLQDSIYKDIFHPFKTEVMRQSTVKSLTASTSIMGNEIYWTNGITRLGNENKTAITLYHLGVDYDFMNAYNLKLDAGRTFSEKFGTDKKAVLLNEKAIAQLGFKDAAEAVNNKIKRG
ncbi:MAG: ABC transporter permease, partial [Bacteroidota bacterium]